MKIYIIVDYENMYPNRYQKEVVYGYIADIGKQVLDFNLIELNEV